MDLPSSSRIRRVSLPGFIFLCPQPPLPVQIAPNACKSSLLFPGKGEAITQLHAKFAD